MESSSWMMGGGRMAIATDDAKGQAVGSHIRMGGRVFGIRIFLDEVVTRRDPPQHKAWETVGVPKLLVIGSYRMGFDIRPTKGGSDLRVFIDYDLPSGPIARLLGRLFADWYAKWCVDQMLVAPAEAFGTNVVAA